MKPLRSRSRSFGPALFVVVVFGVGVCAFWFGLKAFRAHALERAQAKALEVEDGTLTADFTGIPVVTTLQSSAGEIGRATRVFTDATNATIDILVSLPVLDTAVYTYDVWLVKDGLADVVNVGSLTLRADGTWSGIFVAGPSTGVIDPALYTQLVVMIEPRDGNSAPSGVKACTGAW
jgi:hypothetical protein